MRRIFPHTYTLVYRYENFHMSKMCMCVGKFSFLPLHWLHIHIRMMMMMLQERISFFLLVQRGNIWCNFISFHSTPLSQRTCYSHFHIANGHRRMFLQPFVWSALPLSLSIYEFYLMMFLLALSLSTLLSYFHAHERTEDGANIFFCVCMSVVIKVPDIMCSHMRESKCSRTKNQ